jgi:peroxiredoxin
MIERLHDAYPDTDFTLMSVNIDEGRGRENRVQSFVQRFGLSFDVWLDPGQAAAAYGVSNIPYVVIIDREGVVRHVHTGNVSERRLRGEIETLL